VGIDDVEDPVAPENGIDDHGHVVPPDLLVRQLVAQELVFRGWYAQTCRMLVF
jgi:hypothetical protein